METFKKTLPNSTLVLVLGILSIVTCWVWGLIGIALAIIALVVSKKSTEIYNQAPNEYEGYSNLKAGRVMAIVGLALSAVYLLIILVSLIFLGAAAFSLGTLLQNM
ncbi:MAG: DUF4190 domain-containing protein [Bacteroidota bacterium]|nr:MAG: DUF4190 domain-containing protein [Bacteroidota bacterium]